METLPRLSWARSFPVTISIVRLTTEDGQYNFRQFLDGVHFFDGGPAIPVDAPDVRDVTVTHSHSVGIAITFELKAKIKLWSIFSESFSTPIDLSPVLPFPLSANLSGPTFCALSNRPIAAELPEVVWG